MSRGKKCLYWLGENKQRQAESGKFIPLTFEKVRKNIKFDSKVLLMVEWRKLSHGFFFLEMIVDDDTVVSRQKPSFFKLVFWLVLAQKTHDEMPPQERQCTVHDSQRSISHRYEMDPLSS